MNTIFITGGCLSTLYIMAFTSGIRHGGSDRGHGVEVRVDGVTGVKTLPDLPGNDYYPHKGDLWKISFRNDLHFYSCVTKGDIESIAITENSNDGWNIETIVTFVKHGNNFQLATENFNVNRWIDGDGQYSHRRFELNIVL